jgi:RNA methyltransferase, TrmH family
MANEMLLTSTQNPKVKQLMDLRDRKERDATGSFIIEGYRELLRALDAGWKMESLFYCPELYLGSNEGDILKKAESQGARLFRCSETVLRKLSYRDRPDGLVAIAPQRHLTLDDLAEILKTKKNPFLVVAEAIEKPGNLGTILRSSDGVAIDALIVCDRCTDIYNPNVVRASVGTLFTVPVIETSSRAALDWLKKHSIAVLAATPAAESEFTATDMSGPLAIAVGTEQLGLSEVWMSEADLRVKIPMCGVADSLNVAMATTLLLYEALRQRRSHA